MRKTIYAIIMILLAVMLVVPCVAEEGVDWITDRSPSEIMANMVNAEWQTSYIPAFSEEQMVPKIDPLTSTVYCLKSVTMVFNEDNTISTTNTYCPARELTYWNDDLRFPAYKENANTDDVRVEYIEKLCVGEEVLHWGVTSKGYLVMFTMNEEEQAEYKFIYKMFSMDLDKISLRDYYTETKIALHRASK